MYGQDGDTPRGRSATDPEGRAGSTVGDTPTGGEVKPKKRKKKGWKGWALVIEDDDGNVLEVRDRGESPETARKAAEAVQSQAKEEIGG